MKFVSVQALLQVYLSRASSPIRKPASEAPFPVPGYILSHGDRPPSIPPIDAQNLARSQEPLEGSKPTLQRVRELAAPTQGTQAVIPLRALLPHVLMSLFGAPELLASGFGVPAWISGSAAFVPTDTGILDALVRSPSSHKIALWVALVDTQAQLGRCLPVQYACFHGMKFMSACGCCA
jgi:hypothetical protein